MVKSPLLIHISGDSTSVGWECLEVGGRQGKRRKKEREKVRGGKRESEEEEK